MPFHQTCWIRNSTQVKQIKFGALILRALRHAQELRKPAFGLLHHSDRGAQYTSAAYRKQLSKYGMVSSMSRKGNYYDNAVVERFLVA